MTDQCGPLGSTLTNPIITLAPDVLSTYLPFSYEVGSTYVDANGYPGDMFLGTVKPLNIADLQCPTFGVGIGTSADGSLYTTVGPPWLPVIVRPQEAFSLEPSWESACTGLLSFAPGMISFAIFDPPSALSIASHLIAPPSENQPATIPSNAVAGPTTTLDPPAKVSNDPPVKASNDPPILPIPPMESIAPPSENPPGSQGPPDMHTGPISASPGAIALDPAAKPTAGPNPPTHSPSTPQNGDDAPSKSPGLGALIFSALGKTDPQASGSANPVNIIQVPGSGIKEVTVAGQVLSVSPSGVVVDGSSYSLGGPAISLPGGVVSLVPASTAGEAPEKENLIVPVPGPDSGIKKVTVGGQVLSISPSGIILDGKSYSVGGPAITFSDAVVSLAPSSAVGETPNDNGNGPTENQTPASLVRIIAGKTVVSTPSGLVIDGSSLSAGGTPITISNTVISLSPSNVLVVGSSSVSLSAQSISAVGHFLLGPDPPGFVVDGSTNTISAGSHPISIHGIAIQVESSAILVDGVTLRPGGNGALVDGVSVSLEQGGTLDIGNAPFATPTGQVTGSSSLQVFEGSQDRTCDLSWTYLLLMLSVSGVWMLVK